MFLHRKFLGDTESSEFDDVVRNVRYILRSRRGAAWFREDFGLRTEGFRTQEQFVTVLSAQIQETLERYEPRLEVVEVDEEHDDDGKVRLVVRCRLKGHSDELVISQRPGEDLRIERP